MEYYSQMLSPCKRILRRHKMLNGDETPLGPPWSPGPPWAPLGPPGPPAPPWNPLAARDVQFCLWNCRKENLCLEMYQTVFMR